MGWPLIEQQVALIELRAVIGLILVGTFVSCAESPATNSRMRTTRIARRSRTNSESKLTMTIRQIAQARPTKEAIQSSFASICSLPAPPINPSRPQTAGDSFGPSPFYILQPCHSSIRRLACGVSLPGYFQRANLTRYNACPEPWGRR